MEDFPVAVGQMPINSPQGTNSSAVQYWFDNRMSKTRLLSGVGGQDRATITSYFSYKAMVGDSQVLTEKGWTGTLNITGPNPTNNIFCEVFVRPVGGNTMSLGVATRTIVTIYCRMYGVITIGT